MKLAPGIPVQLEESPDGGHYYMSLVDDLLEQRVKDPAELQVFFQICSHPSEWGKQSTAASKGPESSQSERAEPGGKYTRLPPSAHLTDIKASPSSRASIRGPDRRVARSGWGNTST